MILLLLFALLRIEPAGVLQGVSESVQAAVVPEGYRVKDVEVWVNKTIPVEKSAEPARGSDLPAIPHGYLIGVIRYGKPGQDFCGHTVPAGVYTMRYCLLPEDGNHQGVAPRRDFVVLSPAAADQEAAALPAFGPLTEMSRKTSGATHPVTLFLVAPEAGITTPSLERSRENYDVLRVKVGEVVVGIVVAGKAEI
jgi:hypothetical protein